MKHKLCALILAGMMLTAGAVPAHAEEVFSFEAVYAGSGSQSSPAKEPETKPSTPNHTPEDNRQEEWEPAQPEEVDLTTYGEEVLRLTNAEREKAGLSTLKSDPTLTEMAMLRARELEESYSHTRPSGESCKTVFGEYDTALRFYGENAAKGQKTPETVVAAWMDSPGYQANLLREKAEYMGVGVWQDEDGILHWVQLFAKG